MNIFRGILTGAVFICILGLCVTTPLVIAKLSPPHSQVRISLDLGGRLFEYIRDYTEARVEKTTFILDGLCVSACTTITGEIPNDRVCVTPFAKLAFHAPYTTNEAGEREFSKEGSRILWRIYPEWVQTFLMTHGWNGPDNDQPDLIWMDAKELLLVYRACPTS